MRKLLLALVIIAAWTPAECAVVAGKDLYLPSVAHGQGQCPEGICSQWRSDAWVYNPSGSATATVQVFFLHRDQENITPPSVSLTVAPGETRELLDVVLSLFNLDGAYGALRFLSDVDIVVTGRVYDENVVTNKGTGTAGQFFAGLPAAMAIGSGETTDLIGLAQDSADVSRANFGLVETTGAPVTIEVSKRDALGASLATRSYLLRARETTQKSITDIGGVPGTNQRLALRVTGGTGRALAFASRLDNRTGDPSTVAMWVAAPDAGTVTDIDGNVYHTTRIGSQIWMTENLKTTRFNDGEPIQNITDDSDWVSLQTPGYCWYDNDTSSKEPYGALYNWHAVNTGRLAPAGWHVPTREEWATLISHLGGEDVAGGKLKGTGTAHWHSPNAGATNESGFTALGTGIRDNTFMLRFEFSYIWSASPDPGNIEAAFQTVLNYQTTSARLYPMNRFSGFPVRCIRD